MLHSTVAMFMVTAPRPPLNCWSDSWYTTWPKHITWYNVTIADNICFQKLVPIKCKHVFKTKGNSLFANWHFSLANTFSKQREIPCLRMDIFHWFRDLVFVRDPLTPRYWSRIKIGFECDKKDLWSSYIVDHAKNVFSAFDRFNKTQG